MNSIKATTEILGKEVQDGCSSSSSQVDKCFRERFS